MKQEGVAVRVARIFNTFGPRMHMNEGRMVSNFILQALQGEPLTVRGQRAGMGLLSGGLGVRASHPGELALSPMSPLPSEGGRELMGAVTEDGLRSPCPQPQTPCCLGHRVCL